MIARRSRYFQSVERRELSTINPVSGENILQKEGEIRHSETNENNLSLGRLF